MGRPFRPKQTNFGSKQQTRISKKSMAMTVACNAREIPSIEQLTRAPYSLTRAEAQDVILQARNARGIA